MVLENGQDAHDDSALEDIYVDDQVVNIVVSEKLKRIILQRQLLKLLLENNAWGDIDPDRFPDLDRFEVASLRFMGARGALGIVSEARGATGSKRAKNNVDIYFTNRLRELDETFERQTDGIAGTVDRPLLLRHAVFTQPSDQTVLMNFCAERGFPDMVSEKNFQALGAMSQKDRRYLLDCAKKSRSLGEEENAGTKKRRRSLGFEKSQVSS